MKLSSLTFSILLAMTASPAFCSDTSAESQASKDGKTEDKALESKSTQTTKADAKTNSGEKNNKEKNETTSTSLTSTNASPANGASSKAETKAEGVDKGSKVSNDDKSSAANAPIQPKDTATKAANEASQNTKDSDQSKEGSAKAK